MNVLITILDGATETSMPFNEFVLYRANHYSDEKQILIICGDRKELPKVEIPENLEIRYTSRRLSCIRKTIKQVIEDCQKHDTTYAIHIHQVHSGLLAQMAMVGTGFRRKVLFTVHSTFSGYKLHNKFFSFTNALFSKHITCVSKASFADYPRIIKWLKGSRICAIHNGVDVERIDRILSSVNASKKKDGNHFIYVARLIPLKNHAFLVEVLKKCEPNVHFVFVGAEDVSKEIRAKAENAGVADRITFTGLIPRNDVFVKLLEADYYISSSTLEGLPVSVLEAMYCGLPCVLSDIPQHREIAGDEAIVLPYDVEKWATELNRLARLSREERITLSQHIKKYVTDNFALSEMHMNYDMIYSQLR